MKLTGEWALIKPIVWEPGQEELGDIKLVQPSR